MRKPGLINQTCIFVRGYICGNEGLPHMAPDIYLVVYSTSISVGSQKRVTPRRNPQSLVDNSMIDNPTTGLKSERPTSPGLSLTTRIRLLKHSCRVDCQLIECNIICQSLVISMAFNPIRYLVPTYLINPSRSHYHSELPAFSVPPAAISMLVRAVHSWI